jgi:hypothetical protein
MTWGTHCPVCGTEGDCRCTSGEPMTAEEEAYIREVASTTRSILGNFDASGMPPMDALAVLMEVTMTLINRAGNADELLERYIAFLREARQEELDK